jgi:MtrB/PioB family decaheme-associated outer membrane protein
MKERTTLYTLATIIFFLVVPAAAQEVRETKEEGAPEIETERGPIEFGFRTFWGDVYGRPDLPFKPDLETSKLNEYTDIRRNFFIRRARIHFDDVLGTRNYVSYQTQSTFYRNQSHLGTVGEYGKFKVQFRYDDIPHIYTNTARTLYVPTQPGVYTLPLIIRQGLQTASSTGTVAQISNTLPSFIATQVVPSEQFFLPQIQRRSGTGLFTYDVTPAWNVGFSYGREHESGTRPIGTILNTSPTAPASSQPNTVANFQSPGVAEELPEPIDYFFNTVRASTEYWKNKWAIQLGYLGSFFRSDIKSMLFDSAFATADIPVQIIPPGNGCTPAAPAVNCAIASVPAHGQLSLYPNNNANYLSAAGAFNAGKYVRVMGSANNGWLRQNDAFLPYTANTAIAGLGPLPAASLNGDKQTLAMNWRAVSKLAKSFQLEANYRHYDYNNNTRVFELTPIEGDVIGANTTATGQAAPTITDTVGRSNPGFNRKTLELSGNYFFGKRSSAKLGWESEWFDRSHRDVAHSLENTVFGAVDFSPVRDLVFRISGRHQDRKPDEYQDDTASDPVTGAVISCTSPSVVFTSEQRCHRRFDEAARLLDRGEVMVQYDLSRFSFGGLFQTIQSDFNRRGGTNSPVPLNFIMGNTRPYYLYGLLNDLSWIYSFDTTYAFSPAFSAFVEYTHEKYHKRMISRNRTPTSGTQTILTCGGCDTPNNDWESITRDIFNTYAGGFDFFLAKRFWFSPYYSLAAGKGNVLSRALGDPTITAGPNQFVLTAANAPENYPQTATRIHEVAAVFKYKLTPNLMPKFEYRFQQFDNRDYQTTPMTPYMGCVGAGALVVSPPCVNVGPNLASKFPSPFYPGFVVGDTAAARYLFLGADQPSYRAHIMTATLEYHF